MPFPAQIVPPNKPLNKWNTPEYNMAVNELSDKELIEEAVIRNYILERFQK